jgi:hypothetical protein
MPPGARYVQRNLYLRSRLAYQLRNVAIDESWELADLARTMVMVGLTIRELHQAEEEIRSEHKLIIGLEAFTRLVQGHVSRPYRRRTGNRKGVWVTVHFPAGFLKHVVAYARMNGQSLNGALAMFLRDGLLCYLTGYNRFLKALAT